MNKKILGTVLFLFLGNLIFAQDNSPVSALQKLFEVVKKHQYEKAAEMILYKGNNEKRNLKASFNYKNSAEKKQVDRICRRISKYLKISDSYEIHSGENSVINKHKKNTVTVSFKSGAQILNIDFVFVKLNGKFLLSEIE